MASKDASEGGQPKSKGPKSKGPKLTSLDDIQFIETSDPATKKLLYATFFHITDNHEVWFGQTFKHKSRDEMTLDEYQQEMERIPDEEIYPEIPTGVELTMAPDDIAGPVFIKRPGLMCYEVMKETPFVMNSILHETLIMERISKSQHPNIIKYYGCRTARGRITSIVLEEHEHTLYHYSLMPARFQQLDKDRFLEALESAVAHLHSLGLAHNDINPHNIMVGKDGLPILIDFGSCAPYGETLRSLGTEGWYEEEFSTSEKDHDDFALRKLRTWIQNPPSA